MFLRDVIAQRDHSFSFEFYSPKTAAGEASLWRVIEEDLAPLDPAFVSVTYGAGGSTREGTIRLVKRIAAETNLTPVAHLTAVMARRWELEKIIDDFLEGGVRNILALRGDRPQGVSPDQEIYFDGMEHAVDLVHLIRDRAGEDASIGVVAHPEIHPEALDAESDAKFLVEKVQAGADFVLTQFFFEAHHYWGLCERVAMHGFPRHVPIIPGIIPVTDTGQIARFAHLSGADLPAWLTDALASAGEDTDAVRAVGVRVATELCQELLADGAPGIHFYTLNKSLATREIYRNVRN